MQNICLDTGVLGLFFVEPQTPEIKSLISNILNKNVNPHIVKPVLCELFYHLCREFGRDISSTMISSLKHKFPFILVDLDESLITLAGTLKCQHHTLLSYIDCMSLSFCLNNKMAFHTIEKCLQKIPQSILDRLIIVKYHF
jgi:hypothetical protein